MSAEIKKEIQLEIAHVLFIDIVGYSKLLINEQRALLETLNQVVRGTEQFRSAETSGRLLKIATGDGMALVYYSSPEAPVECALEISRALNEHPQLRLRMGVHSGPVSGVVDVNDRANVAGAGINIAQRVMDCGDAGHILLSKHVAEDLEQYGHWQPHLHDLGECEVKHGTRVHVVNLYTEELGNPAVPEKFKRAGVWRKAAKPAALKWAVIGAVVLIIGAVGLLISRQSRTARAARSATPSMPAIPEKSIAVLPFQSLSKDEENAFFTDGVQDEILTYLAKVGDLKVISHTSVMQYKNAAARNLREIAQQLGVAHVLEGSVQRAEKRVRVNAQLIDARNDAHLWAQTYDRELADIFAIQSEIAQTIAEQLQARLSSLEKAAIAEAPTTDLIANDLYVRAEGLANLADDPGAKESLLRAVGLLDEAVARDPRFLLAYCLLSRVHLELYWGGFDHSLARRDLGNAALQNAAHLQPDGGEVHKARAIYAYNGFRDYDRARAELDLARRTLPNDAGIHIYAAAIDRRQARWNEAIQNFTRAVELDPRNFSFLEEAAFTYAGLRHWAEAKQLLERTLSVSPRDYFVRTVLAEIPFFERGDLGPWRIQLSAIVNEGADAAAHITFALVSCALAERDSGAAARAIATIPPEGLVDPFINFLLPRDWFVGLVARSFGDAAAAQTAFTAARVIAEKAVRDQPEYAPSWSLLGMIDAGLGRKEDAVREGRHACELLPLSNDAWDGPTFITNLAIIYAWIGERDVAFEQLAISAKNSAGVTYGELKLSPMWDPLRGDSRFDQIVALLAPEEAKKSEVRSQESGH